MSTNGYNDDAFPRKFGNYHLLAPLAQGGMGALYLAVKGDRGLERLLVIKTVLPHLADAEYIARFRDEAKVVVKLSHANLIPVFDAGSVDGELYMTMDFVEGRDLRGVWNRCAKKQVAFPVDVAVYVTKELCRGLAYAHSFSGLQLVHRDVSPPNVLISYSGDVKVMDFGLANSTLKMEKTAPGIIYGKVAYMSPEQARGEPLDGRSDLYAAAIVLWELLTGRQLFPPGKDQPQDLLQRARNPLPMPPSKRAPRVPVELDAIVMKGLAPNRDDRYRDGEEFRQALAGWLATDAPGTDAARLERFLHNLFEEDIERERAEREQLLRKIRHRAKTMPPTDELRQLFEGELGGALGAIEESVRRSSDTPGRRATDRGDATRDRRTQGERRHGARDEVTGDQGDGGQGKTPGVGQVIDNRYRIVKLIGEGGMGKVYHGEHVEIGRKVAIKILHPVYSRMPDLVERFRLEARAATRIGHPNIVDVTDSGKTGNGSTYFVMEYLEGEELGDVIAREGALEITRCIRIVIQICRALAAAHKAGIIHRDLKPENIFLITHNDVPDFVKVLDFGVATGVETGKLRTKRLTTPGTAMGTPEYMAPEQAAGQQADERCDVYALGSILYEGLTGTPPYKGDNFMEILTKKATLEPTPVSELRPELPQDLVDVITRATAREPENRPESMDILEIELEACLEAREGVEGIAAGFSGRYHRAGTEPDAMGPRLSRPETNRPSDIAMLESTMSVSRVVNVRSRWILIGILGFAIALVTAIIVVLLVLQKDGGASDGAALDARTGTLIDAAPNDAGSETTPPVDADVAIVVPDASPPPVDAAVEQPDAKVAVATGIPNAEADKLLKEAGKLSKSFEFNKAKPLYKKVASTAASSSFRARAHLGLAEVAFQQDDMTKTIRHAKRARRAGWRADLWLARAYSKQNNIGIAVQHYKKVLRRKSNLKEAREFIDKHGG